MKIKLLQLAHARSGDKGDTVNIGVIVYKQEYFPFLKEYLTAEKVKKHFRGICKGDVERYELPNIGALNFVLHRALGGGGTSTLRHDAQGKTLSTAMLRYEISLPDNLAKNWRLLKE
jgi:hypothetical protein